MKRLNKVFSGGKRTSRDEFIGEPSAPTDTLHRIVNAKEEVSKIQSDQINIFKNSQKLSKTARNVENSLKSPKTM